jgi:hypothetical protein
MKETPMSETFDALVKSALDIRAESVPDEVVARVSDTDYHPRSRGRRSVMVAGGGVGAVAAVVSVTLGVFGPGVQSAFASWSPSPTTPQGDQVSSAVATCTQAVAYWAGQANGANPQSPIPVTATGLSPVLEDVRGDFTLVALTSTNSATHDFASCLTGGSSWPAGPQILLSSSNGSGESTIGLMGPGNGDGQAHPFAASASSSIGAGAAPNADNVGGPSTNWNSVSNDEVATGEAGSAVTGVTLELSDGARVTATLSNGFYGAWWPGNASVTTINVTTVTGSHTMTVRS